jgi:hypothetical protein
MKPPQEPVLDSPGAGLPALELFIGRMLFALRRSTADREQMTQRFCEERSIIRRRVDEASPSKLGVRVLIPRLPGMEDSSRHWSVWMTLDHLRITNEAFAGVISSLVAGRMPEGEASTAAVKPSPDVTGAVDEAYEKSCDHLLAVLNDSSELKTPLRYKHPWFGPLDASGWHALAGMHMGIHRGQIEQILTAQNMAH